MEAYYEGKLVGTATKKNKAVTAQLDVALSEIDQFEECGLCGTAAVISPVGTIDDHGTIHQYAGFGPKIQKLYETLTGIQMGTVEAPEGWIVEIL